MLQLVGPAVERSLKVTVSPGKGVIVLAVKFAVSGPLPNWKLAIFVFLAPPPPMYSLVNQNVESSVGSI